MPKGEHKAIHLREHDFKPLAEKALSRKPVTVKLPPEVDQYVRSKPNINQWLNQAVIEKVARELHELEQSSIH